MRTIAVELLHLDPLVMRVVWRTCMQREPACEALHWLLRGRRITYRVLVGNGWTAGWARGNVLALFVNPDVAGNSSMVAILCGPMAGAVTCASGQPGSDLALGNITRASILGTSTIDYDTLFVLCAVLSWPHATSHCRVIRMLSAASGIVCLMWALHKQCCVQIVWCMALSRHVMGCLQAVRLPHRLEPGQQHCGCRPAEQLLQQLRRPGDPRARRPGARLP